MELTKLPQAGEGGETQGMLSWRRDGEPAAALCGPKERPPPGQTSEDGTVPFLEVRRSKDRHLGKLVSPHSLL